MPKKPFLIVASLALGAMLLSPIVFGAPFNEYLEAIVFTSLAVGACCLLAGIILLFVHIAIPTLLPYAQASFLMAGIILLISFTLCSTGAVDFS